MENILFENKLGGQFGPSSLASTNPVTQHAGGKPAASLFFKCELLLLLLFFVVVVVVAAAVVCVVIVVV